MTHKISSLLLFCLLPLSGCARSEPLLDVQVVDLDQGNVLERIRHSGREHIEGRPGHRFAVQLHNRSSERVLAVLAVDGVNAISGQTASTSQTGYVLEPWQQAEIRGWRKSHADIAEFYFTDLPDSYAARTGRPIDVGVIGVAAFRERRREPEPYYPGPVIGQRERSAAADSASGAMATAESSPAPSSPQRIGTGHGQRRYDPVTETDFERDSSRPNQVIALYYDSLEALVERGIIRGRRDYAQRPEPFPIGFTPDP